jgi:3-phosphoshikimate 1-carboxyvinyltransferase
VKTGSPLAPLGERGRGGGGSFQLLVSNFQLPVSVIDFPMTRKVHPARRMQGTVILPGDKSISHRYALLGAIAEGTTEIRGFASSADCQSTLNCLEALGVQVGRQNSVITIIGGGLEGLLPPLAALHAGNSGSTLRMLAGILAGQSFKSCLTGDASLSRRPMKRIIDPLTQMGARIGFSPGWLPPLEIQGPAATPIRYQSPVASAQVKTAVLFAGLFAEGETVVEESAATRNHTEIALEQMGAPIERRGRTVSVRGRARLSPARVQVPGDVSSAAFFLVAALMLPGSDIILRRVGLNPTRTAAIDLLTSMGAELEIAHLQVTNGERVGDVRVRFGPLEGGEIPIEMIPGLIDELPVLAVLGTRMRQGLSFRGAAELRVKESDRLRAVAENLRRMGAQVEEFPDGLRVPGGQTLRGAEIESCADHRIAMAFAVAGLTTPDGVAIRGSECVEISFPEFFETLEGATA